LSDGVFKEEEFTMRYGRLLFLIALVGVLGVGHGAAAWKAPQDRWISEVTPLPSMSYAPYGVTWDGTNFYVFSSGSVWVYSREWQQIDNWGSGELSDARGICASMGEIFVADYGDDSIKVFSPTGGLLRTFTNVVSGPMCVAADMQRVYVTESSSRRFSILDRSGTLIGRVGRSGSLPSEFDRPYGIAVDHVNIYVADTWNKRIQIFTKDGGFVREWYISPPYDTNNHDGDHPYAIAVHGGVVYVGTGHDISGWNDSSYIRAYDTLGRRLWQDARAEGADTDIGWKPRGMVVVSPYLYVVDNARKRLNVYRSIFRTLGTSSVGTRAIPSGVVLSVSHRTGTAIADIDYTATDNDTSTVSAFPLAFTNDTPSLAACLPMTSLVDGTAANIGTNVTVGVTNRISWEVGADWNVDYGDIRIGILAKDDRELLDIHWLHLPAVDPNPALTINRYPITENDLLNLWFWVIASGNTAVTVADGEVTGVGGDYDAESLATDAGTTERGRAFLFEMLGCREATAAELVQAREASTPGSVTQWTPRYTLPTGVPRKVNEFGFDSGSTDAHGWWVVK
jgi:hypothetical protein